MQLIRIILGICILGLSMSCGFHLRGGDMERLPLIYIEGGNPQQGIHREIERMVENLGKDLAPERDQAEIILQINQEDYQRTPLSISRQLSVQEYELIYMINFQMNDVTGKIISPAQTLTFTRDYSFADTNQILGKANEENLLRQEMLYDGVSQILAQVLARN